MRTDLKEKNWIPLIGLIPSIEKSENFGKYSKPTKVDDNVFIYNGHTYSRIVNEFFHLVYSCGLIYDFDWMNWDLGKSILENKSNTTFKNYDLDTLNKLIITIVRNDKFCDGYLISKFSDGTILNILKSAESLIKTNHQENSNMKIIDFKNFIREIPFRNQSFDIKKSNWECENQIELIERIFDGKNVITLNRFDLINSNWNIEEFIIKTLMWGYPTKGRGKNIDNLLLNNNFKTLTKQLESYRESEITIETLKQDLKIPGLGLSTLTKFAHFLNTRIDGFKTVILDKKIIEAINTGRFKELNSLNGIRYDNAIGKYVDYIKLIDKISIEINSEPDQIEMFLYTFGRNLSELKGEEGDYSEL